MARAAVVAGGTVTRNASRRKAGSRRDTHATVRTGNLAQHGPRRRGGICAARRQPARSTSRMRTTGRGAELATVTMYQSEPSALLLAGRMIGRQRGVS